jgi:ribosomal-protein-alanine N-acetyltransferase
MQILRTNRLTLVPQVVSHAEEMFLVLRDPELYKHENEPPPSIKWLRQRFSKLETRVSPDGTEQWLNWVLRLPSSQLIGYVQATISLNNTAAIAYVLSSQHWGQGLATEAVKAMIVELTVRYQVQDLTAVFKRENIKSQRLLERLDFSRASPEDHKRAKVEPDELLMLRKAHASALF